METAPIPKKLSNLIIRQHGRNQLTSIRKEMKLPFNIGLQAQIVTDLLVRYSLWLAQAEKDVTVDRWLNENNIRMDQEQRQQLVDWLVKTFPQGLSNCRKLIGDHAGGGKNEKEILKQHFPEAFKALFPDET
jgi:CHAT domain-containing protein